MFPRLPAVVVRSAIVLCPAPRKPSRPVTVTIDRIRCQPGRQRLITVIDERQEDHSGAGDRGRRRLRLLARKADLRAFDPVTMAQLETALWRDNYQKHYPRLFCHLDEASRTQFGFSPLDSFRIALSAAHAAKTFQPTRSRREADAALLHLVTYYRLPLPAAPAAFDVDEAARLELDWWQARHEAVGPRGPMASP
jgi:hypothetical protein